MSAQILEFPQRVAAPTSTVTSHRINRRTVRRLGGIYHKYECECGIAIESLDEEQVKDGFFTYHAHILGLFDSED